MGSGKFLSENNSTSFKVFFHTQSKPSRGKSVCLQTESVHSGQNQSVGSGKFLSENNTTSFKFLFHKQSKPSRVKSVCLQTESVHSGQNQSVGSGKLLSENNSTSFKVYFIRKASHHGVNRSFCRQNLSIEDRISLWEAGNF